MIIPQVGVELRLFLRNRQTVFFTVAFPVLMMILFGYLNRGASIGDMPYVNFLLPGAIGMSVMAAAFENLSTMFARQREDRILKRLGGTPLRPWVLLGAKLLTASVIIFLQTLLLISIGVFFFEVKIVGSPWTFFTVLLAGIMAFTSMGFTLAGLIKSADTESAAAHAVYLPMLFICGAFFPVDLMPDLLQRIAEILPLTYFINPVRNVLVEGSDLAGCAGDLLVLTGWMIGCFIITVKTFKWE